MTGQSSQNRAEGQHQTWRKQIRGTRVASFEYWEGDVGGGDIRLNDRVSR